MGEFVVEVAKDRFQGVSKVAVDASARTSFLSSIFRCGSLSLVVALNLLGAVLVRADTTTSAAGPIVAQLSPLLDSLTEAAASMAQSNRTTAATQLGSTVSLADSLMATVQSPDMTVALGTKSKTLQRSLSRFHRQLLKAEAAVNNSRIKDSAVLKAISRAVTVGQQLKALVPTPPSTPPAAPSNLAVMIVTPTSITLDWQNNADNELGFQIQRAKSPAGPWNVVGAVGAGVTSYRDTGLEPSTTYYYVVAAFN
jgi:hypothetical protein